MAEEWPQSTAPFNLLHAGYNEEFEDNAYRFTPAAGEDITRRKTTKRVDQITGNIVWTTAQLAVAEEFYSDNLADGAIAFQSTHPRTGEVSVLKFKVPLKISPYGLKFLVAVDVGVVG